MKNSSKIFALLSVLAILASGCKRCYQCVVRDAADDEISWGYKEICVTKIFNLNVFQSVQFREEEKNKGDHPDGELLIQIVQFPVSKLVFHFQQSPCEALGMGATKGTEYPKSYLEICLS